VLRTTPHSEVVDGGVRPQTQPSAVSAAAAAPATPAAVDAAPGKHTGERAGNRSTFTFGSKPQPSQSTSKVCRRHPKATPCCRGFATLKARLEAAGSQMSRAAAVCVGVLVTCECLCRNCQWAGENRQSRNSLCDITPRELINPGLGYVLKGLFVNGLLAAAAACRVLQSLASQQPQQACAPQTARWWSAPALTWAAPGLMQAEACGSATCQR
jgi:hypothetical protein